MRPFIQHERQTETPQRHADPRGHDHVVVHILPANQERQAAAQHPDRRMRMLCCGNAANGQVAHHQHHRRVGHHHEPHAPARDAKDPERRSLQPVQKRWLVEKRNAIDPRNQPVARHQHPAAYFAISALVGNRQRPQRRQHKQHGNQKCHGKPVFAMFIHARIVAGRFQASAIAARSATQYRVFPNPGRANTVARLGSRRRVTHDHGAGIRVALPLPQ